MTVGAVHFLVVGAAMLVLGAFAVTYRRNLEAALAGAPLMLGGAGLAFVGASRFAALQSGVFAGQELAVLLVMAALAIVLLGLGMIGREGLR